MALVVFGTVGIAAIEAFTGAVLSAYDTLRTSLPHSRMPAFGLNRQSKFVVCLLLTQSRHSHYRNSAISRDWCPFVRRKQTEPILALRHVFASKCESSRGGRNGLPPAPLLQRQAFESRY